MKTHHLSAYDNESTCRKGLRPMTAVLADVDCGSCLRSREAVYESETGRTIVTRVTGPDLRQVMRRGSES